MELLWTGQNGFLSLSSSSNKATSIPSWSGRPSSGILFLFFSYLFIWIPSICLDFILTHLCALSHLCIYYFILIFYTGESCVGLTCITLKSRCYLFFEKTKPHSPFTSRRSQKLFFSFHVVIVDAGTKNPHVEMLCNVIIVSIVAFTIVFPSCNRNWCISISLGSMILKRWQ